MLGFSSYVARRISLHAALSRSPGAGLRTSLCSPVFFPLSSTPVTPFKRYYSGPPANIGSGIKPSLSVRIVHKVKEEFHRFVEGSKLLGRNTYTATALLNEVRKGHTLSRRERLLMIRTLGDLMRMVPFIVIVIVPFAEFALPVLLKVFPNMLPSTFTSASQKEAAQARTLQAKLKVIEVLQAASESINLRVKLDSKEAQESLATFLTKVARGEQIKHDEVLTMSQIFHNEFGVESLERAQLVSLVKFFGLPSIGNDFILQESFKFKWNSIKRDDAHIRKDGIDSLSQSEISDAAIVRGFNPTNSHQDQKQYLQEWISLSEQNVPPYLLLLSRAQYFVKNTKKVADIAPPVIAPYLSPTPEQVAAAPTSQTTVEVSTEKPDAQLKTSEASEEEKPTDIPESELLSAEFKNLSHELSHDPVVSKLWSKIARYTNDLKKETFGGRESEVIHLGDSSAANLSTVITAELRQYLQAMFIALDKDGDQRLTVDEVEHGLNASDIPVRHEEVVELMKKFDYNGDGHLQFDEFVDCLLYLRKTRD